VSDSDTKDFRRSIVSFVISVAGKLINSIDLIWCIIIIIIYTFV